MPEQLIVTRTQKLRAGPSPFVIRRAKFSVYLFSYFTPEHHDQTWKTFSSANTELLYHYRNSSRLFQCKNRGGLAGTEIFGWTAEAIYRPHFSATTV
jgi:hypothetical protein